MSIRLSPTTVLDSVEATALTTHRSSVGTDHANVGVNDTHVAGDGSDHTDVATSTTELAQEQRVKVSTLAMDSVNEVSQAIGGSAANEFVPTEIVVHLEDDGAAGGATGDMQITVGTSAGGTQILGATATTNLDTLNDRFTIAITGLTAAIAADSTLYVKATTRDTTAVGYTCDIYIRGQVFVSGT